MKIVSGEHVGRWVCKKLKACYEEGAQGVGLERSGEITAGVCYENWNGRSIMCHIVIDQPITRSYLFAIFHYPFEYLGVDKIIVPVVETNTESIRFVEKLGFSGEATLRGVHPDGDMILYTMKREDCRFLGARYGQGLSSAAASA